MKKNIGLILFAVIVCAGIILYFAYSKQINNFINEIFTQNFGEKIWNSVITFFKTLWNNILKVFKK